MTMKKHQYSAGWPIGHCIHCGHETGLDSWQLVDMPKELAACTKSNVKPGIIERLTDNYDCLAPNSVMLLIG